jgi:hypothetical protein
VTQISHDARQQREPTRTVRRGPVLVLADPLAGLRLSVSLRLLHFLCGTARSQGRGGITGNRLAVVQESGILKPGSASRHDGEDESKVNVADRVAFLRAELDRQLARASSQRRRDKGMAFRLQMATVALSAAITVLLGVRVGTRVQPVLADVALAFGALVTVLAAFEAFYNHRGLWVNRTVTVQRLYELRRRVEYQLAGLVDGEVQPDVVDELFAQLNQILADDNQAWLRLRSVEAHPSTPGTPPGTGGKVALLSQPDDHAPGRDGAT